jgi:hypothetical protein
LSAPTQPNAERHQSGAHVPGPDLSKLTLGALPHHPPAIMKYGSARLQRADKLIEPISWRSCSSSQHKSPRAVFRVFLGLLGLLKMGAAASKRKLHRL